jgi:hypothetical protein
LNEPFMRCSRFLYSSKLLSKVTRAAVWYLNLFP